MKHRLIAAAIVLGVLGAIVCGELVALRLSDDAREAKLRREAVELLGLPDLAIATGSGAFRHRSLTDLDSLFGDDPELGEYLPGSYVYAVPSVVTGGGVKR